MSTAGDGMTLLSEYNLAQVRRRRGGRMIIEQECILVGAYRPFQRGSGVSAQDCLPRGMSARGQGVSVRGVYTYLHEQNSWHTLVKTIPFRNFVCVR